jgi:hypothetical protein
MTRLLLDEWGGLYAERESFSNSETGLLHDIGFSGLVMGAGLGALK